MAVRALTELLDRNQVNYHCYNHPPTATAAQTAQSTHIPGDHMAKTVIVSVDGELAMAVLPANEYVDPDRLRQALGARHLSLAREDQFKDRFPLCEVGGEPPFGTLYDMRVFIDESLLKQDWLAFNAGSHTEVIKMGMGDFLKLSQPESSSFAMHH
ncbi:hypothetical protein B5T_00250 [Alloalcanivorax dieselolei B5]|uniref:YbaK/aminoacyl-tRNA synthetase-associated domain-containing protein n=1 Tax=Alcanivorax dieselolei (strain DSM 16502 / CGMCC 1.3690 / MCCC 1A00001 / B-5) TaxID=930169 RepID=K0C9W9_ALCDB|nr:YbaK/EbsC family protein [Alloalcanivorax dieselolei]AFT68537.1 hypothetical protein B5T_00250 [Alloalcanivorax dieselolei B5]GGJ98864.1 deacylase [Alloalcanivorax dieselolei]